MPLGLGRGMLIVKGTTFGREFLRELGTDIFFSSSILLEVGPVLISSRKAVAGSSIISLMEPLVAV